MPGGPEPPLLPTLQYAVSIQTFPAYFISGITAKSALYFASLPARRKVRILIDAYPYTHTCAFARHAVYLHVSFERTYTRAYVRQTHAAFVFVVGHEAAAVVAYREPYIVFVFEFEYYVYARRVGMFYGVVNQLAYYPV